MIDPILYFSKYQASFYQNIPLERKIYTVTASALLGIADCFLSILIHDRMKPQHAYRALTISGTLFLLCSTMLGYFSSISPPQS